MFFTQELSSRNLLRKFLAQPRTIGSVAPSSRFLACRMVAPVPWEEAVAIAELGAGTGVFTRAIRERCLPRTQVIVFEQDPQMCAYLQAAFPAFHHRADARQLTATLQELGLPCLDAIISGLPLGSLPASVRDAVMDEVHIALKPGGLFIQFQYSLLTHRELTRRFSRVRTNWIPINLPPAFVYVCTK